MDRESHLPGYCKVLCILRLHHNGILEVRPDFSQMHKVERFHDSNIFVNEDTLNFWKKHGVPLTTYNFRSASGTQYQYSLELLNMNMNSLDSIATGNETSIKYEHWRILSRRSAWLEKLKNHTIPSDTAVDVLKSAIMLMEVSSAKNFRLKAGHFSSLRESTVCINFHVVLESNEDEKSHRRPNYKILLSGQTQWSKAGQNQRKCTPLSCWNFPKPLFLLIFLEMVTDVKRKLDS